MYYRKFEWDENKNRINIAKHAIDFNDIPELFMHPVLVKRDVRKKYREGRWIAIGHIREIELVVVFTLRKEHVRIISARRASENERKRYRQKISH